VVTAVVEQYRTRAAYIRANVDRHPVASERDRLRQSAAWYESQVEQYETQVQLFESKARRRQRLQTAAIVAAPVLASSLFLVPSLVTDWADVSVQVTLAVFGGSLALTAAVLHLQWLIAWLESRRPMHASAREAELKYGDREPAAPPQPKRRRPQPVGRVIDGEVA
jgi:hypothetical protein